MKPIRLFLSRDHTLTTLDVGATIRLKLLPKDVTGTLIDPEILMKGCRIDFPKGIVVQDPFKRDIDHIVVPPVSPDGRLEKSGEMVFLHPVTVAGNQILSYLEINEGHIKLEDFQRVVRIYYWALLDRISGHRGVIATNISSTRMAHSGRLVLIPQIERSPEWFGICEKAMERAGIKEGELVIIFRDPVIWYGSIEVGKAYPIKHNVIQLHPLLFKQLGADCDGDQVAFVKPPDEPGVKEELEANILKHTRKYARWPKHLCGPGQTDVPDWDNIIEDTKNRFVIDGKSYGPGDVRGWKDTPPAIVTELEQITGKAGRGERNKTLSSDADKRLKLILETNKANLHMKGYLGVVGATARRILLVMGEDPWLADAANRCSETIQQTTLDSKHNTDKGEAVSPIDIMNLFERKFNWCRAPIDICVETLVKAGLIEEDARRLVLHLRIELPIVLYAENFLKPVQVSKIRECIRECVKDGDKAAKQINVMPAINMAARFSSKRGQKVTPDDVIQIVKYAFPLGLTAIVEIYYPSFALTHKSVSWDFGKAVHLYEQVFHKGLKDRGSVFKLLWEERESVSS